MYDNHVPKDQSGNDDTNASRAKPYDWVLPNAALNNCHTATIIDSRSFANGLVYDSRVTSPYSLRPSPILSGDSGVSGMQHMGVVKDFVIPSGDGETTNSAPNLNYISNLTIQAGVTTEFSVTAVDMDDDVITLTCSDSSHFSSVPASGSVTGTFSWIPLESDCDDHAVLFTAESGGLYSQQMINISVIPEPFLIINIYLLFIIYNRKYYVRGKNKFNFLNLQILNTQP